MLYNINQTAKLLCVSQSTLRRWEKEGKIMSEKTSGGHRRYDIDKITFVKQNVNENRITIAYARVSTYDQKNDLNRQKEVLSLFCASKGYVYKIIEDLGSGLNYNKKGFNELVEMICRKQVDKIIITHKDRLIRFGFNFFEKICLLNNVQLIIINKDDEKTDDNKEFVNDVLEIITHFSAKLYGKRSHKNKEILEANKKIFINK